MIQQVRYWAAATAILGVVLAGVEASYRGESAAEERDFVPGLDHRRSLKQKQIVFDTTTKIVGGSKVSAGAYKFIASLRFPDGYEKSGTHYCGGALIASNVVVTAAHCVHPIKGKNIDVHLGRSDREGSDTVNFESYRTKEIRIHSRYNSYTRFNYDIALLILDGETSITPVKMRRDDKCFELSASCGYADVFGWGLTDPNSSDSYSSVLMSVRVPLVGKQECVDLYSGDGVKITSNMVCAGGVVGKDSCGGDSGGPLLINNQLSGVVSFGPKMCGSKFPGVYSNIAYFINWIDGHLIDINGVASPGTPSPSPVPSPSPPASKPKTCQVYRYGRLIPYRC